MNYNSHLPLTNGFGWGKRSEFVIYKKVRLKNFSAYLLEHFLVTPLFG